MPQGLPASVGLTVNTAAKGNDVSLTSSTPSLVINANTVLTSVCDTLLSSKASTPTTPVANSTVNIVVVSSSTVCTPAISDSISSVSSTVSSNQYKLSEIVNKEKDTWFKQDKKSDLELEPPRGEQLSVRKRSRQFFTLVELEEDDVDSDSMITQAPSDQQGKESEVYVDPILNLGDSLRRLYFPKEHSHHRKNRKTRKGSDSDDKTENHRPSSASGDRPLSAGYDKDSERGKMGLFDMVFLNPELRSFSSNPCVNEIPETDSNEVMGIGSRKSKSLPTTPRVSPKLLRKKSMTVDNNPDSKGPGFSFLASVAGDVRLNKLRKDQIHEQQLQRISEKNKKGVIVKTNNAAVASHESSSVVSNTSVSGDKEHHELEHTRHVCNFSEYLGHDIKSENPNSLMKSLIDWGTQKTIKVSNKETNMFSPTSF